MQAQNPRFWLLATLRALGWLLLQVAIIGCDSEATPATGEHEARKVRVASLVPAVTNILVELDQTEKLVAVSNYDTDSRVQGLPRVGDLLTIDWEQLAAARPTHMLIQIPAEKTPAGALQRARELGIKPVHVKIERLQDIAATIDQLENELGGGQGAWRARFERELAEAAGGRTGAAVPTLIGLSSDLSFVAGRKNYLDDLLELAGGENVAGLGMAPYPTLDPEQLMTLRPERIVIILPNATEAQLAEARHTVDSLRAQWGLGWESVTVLADPYAMVPGWSVIEIARALGRGSAAASRPADAPPAALPPNG